MSPSRMVASLFVVSLAAGQEVVGERPYEMVWANRNADFYPPLVDFEQVADWQVEVANAEATFAASREKLIWGERVGQLTYRGTGPRPSVRFAPPQPIAIAQPFDTVSLWVHGNALYRPTPARPQPDVTVHLAAQDGTDVALRMTHVNYNYWYLAYRKLTSEQQALLAKGATFTGIEVTGGTNTVDQALFFDNLACFQEKLPPLTFEPRPQRGIPMFEGQSTGTNTGPGKLPFPTRLETVLPANLTRQFKTAVAAAGDAFTLSYAGDDGRVTWRLTPRTGTWSDWTVSWEGRGQALQPLVDGGVWLVGPNNTVVLPEKTEHLGTKLVGDVVESRWRVAAGSSAADVTYRYRIWQKSLVVDVLAPGGQVAEVRYGRAVGLDTPRLVQVPYYVYTPGRPMVAVSGSATQPLFLMGNTCWYLSNGSVLFGAGTVAPEGVSYNGGSRYVAKTDGRRNDVYERFFVTLSPRFEEVLPTIPNPASTWKDVTGTKVWRAHGAGNRESDIAYWRKVHRYGMREIVVTDHESMWRDSDESFTFRTKAAPKKGGDEGAARYSRIMQDELGFTYGPYNNFTDFATVNEFFTPDRVSRLPDGQLQGAWYRCYAPKPAYAVEACAKLSPINQAKYRFSTAYCDVHTAVAPWSRTDYDARVPGAGTFAAVVYSYGEIMLHQKAAWGGPVYSEGNHHCFLHGLTDGNYAQDQDAKLPDNPWLVDFDLLKMHDLGCNFGMGNIGMFYGRESGLGGSREEMTFNLDRFLAATIAFGHPGFLVMDGGFDHGLRSYYMVQQLAAAYTRVPVQTIRYVAADGRLLDTSAAVASGEFARCQVVNTYANGTLTVVNGSRTERLRTKVGNRSFDLPPAGYAGYSADGTVAVEAGEVAGHRVDYAATPAYVYLDGRGRFTRRPKAASAGIAILRALPQGRFEAIPYGGECGFAIGATAATAEAFDADRKSLGTAPVRFARGLAYVQPVDQAVSYELTPSRTAGPVTLTCNRDEVVPGEAVVVKGRQAHPFRIPTDAQPGQRLWQSFEGAWIDFTVKALADVSMEPADDHVTVRLRSNLAAPTAATIKLLGRQQPVTLRPGEAAEVRFELGQPTGESLQDATLEVLAGDLRTSEAWTLRTVLDRRHLLNLSSRFQAGMQLRGQAETTDAGALSAARAAASLVSETTAGNVTKTRAEDRLAFNAHPPYVGGSGYVYALLEPVTLPVKPAAMLRGVVGKGDGSDLGDGIYYEVQVVDAAGRTTKVAEQTVKKHEWLPIEADLERWAGQTVRLKLVCDAGPADDTSGDWGRWADLRLETRDRVPVRTLEPPGSRYSTAPGEAMLPGLTVAMLRGAKSGSIHYDGANLAGSGAHPTFAMLNGVKMGNMAPAGGDPAQGKWAEDVRLELTREAIAALDTRNVLAVENPNGNCFKVRRFWIDLELADGRRATSRITTPILCQPPSWLYFEGIGTPMEELFSVEMWFDTVP